MAISNKAIIEVLTNRLRENLASYYPDMASRDAIITGKPIGGPYAKTYRFELDFRKNKKTVYIKICPVYQKLKPAEIEYETLNLLYPKMPGVNALSAVSRPLDYFPDLNAYAMESVEGENVKTYLLKNNSKLYMNNSGANLESVISGCAKWLSVFHDLTRSDSMAQFDSASFIQSITDSFDYKRLRNFRFDRTILDDLDNLIDRVSFLDGAFEIPCAKWHWDYTPGHAYLENGKISVIDILGLDNIPIYEDIGHFAAAMTLTNNLPLYPFFDRERAGKELCNTFFDAYLNETGDIQKDVFHLLSNVYKLKYLIVYFGGQYERVSEKIHPLVGRAFANHRSARLIEVPLRNTIECINSTLDKLSPLAR